MTMKSYKSLARERLRQAKEDGVHHPVVACLWRESTHAREIYRERHGHSIKARKDNSRIILETWSVKEARDLLRRHAGIGGAAVANLIEELSKGLSWWEIGVQPLALTVKGFETPFPGKGWSRATFDNFVPYDELLDTLCRRCEKKLKGRGATRIHLHDGETTVVCGASFEELAATIKLVTVADTRRLQSLCLGQTTALLNLRDKDLSLILRRLYLDSPEVVAEAIRALRKAPGDRDAWLRAVLNKFPSLGGLADAVRHEIEGV